MVEVSYVYPNVSGITQRGGLLERWQLAKKLGCNYIEVPADFIKNKTEMNKTGLKLGDFLTKESISVLYEKDCNIPQEVKYILHTEPSLRRNDGYGMSYQAPLKWFDREWVERFVNMIISITKFFNIPAAVIEIHSGSNRNSFEDIVRSIIFILDKYYEVFKVKPLILIENRTKQLISNGREIQSFWRFLTEKYCELKEKVRIVLDVQQLFTVTKENFLTELEKIPLEALKGFHIHYKHRVPNLSDEIPWKQVFNKITYMKSSVIINPEILHKDKVKIAINFCEKMLRSL